MSARWVAAGVRSRGLASHRLGIEGARRVAGASSLAQAVETLLGGPYGRRLRPGMGLDAAQRAVADTAVWNLRVLAGWGSGVEAGGMRILATLFEIPWVTDHLRALAGSPVAPPVDLGALSTLGRTVGRAASPDEVRRALARSPWGDPGVSDIAGIRSAMQLAWARRVVLGVPAAARWAAGFAALVVARAGAAGALSSLGGAPRHDARRVLGPGWDVAGGPPELRRRIPRSGSWVLEGVDDVEGLWRAECRWWHALDSDGRALLARSGPGEASTIGAFGMLVADAWRVRAALEMAARGGHAAPEIVDALG